MEQWTPGMHSDMNTYIWCFYMLMPFTHGRWD